MIDTNTPLPNEDEDEFSLDDSGLEEDIDESNSTKLPSFKIAVGLLVVVILLVIVFAIVPKIKSTLNKSPEPPVIPQEQVDQPTTPIIDLPVNEPEVETIDPNTGLTPSEEDQLNKAIGIGVQTLTGNNSSYNSTPITPDDFTKDYNSTDIPMYYEIKSIREVDDFISYTKYRTTTADGVELYWLDGSYNGKPVRLTTTLSVFKELAQSGVCPVKVEVTVTKDGNQIITGFTVNTNTEAKQKK